MKNILIPLEMIEYYAKEDMNLLVGFLVSMKYENEIQFSQVIKSWLCFLGQTNPNKDSEAI